MKYFSEVTKKFYDDVEVLEKEEQEKIAKEDAAKKAREEKIAKRADRAKAVENSYKAFAELCAKNRKLEDEAYKEYLDLRNLFVNDYGSFHMSYTTQDDSDCFSTYDLVKEFLKIFDI